jgi:glycosyltransferase involved in cell wall biosynthesis
LGLDDQVVRFVGRVDEAGLVAALQRADVSVSVPASDATSVAMLESMACALPVVATDLPANRAWVKTLQLVPVDDVGALTAALISLADDPSRRRAIGRDNRQAVRNRAARDAHMDRMAELYESLPVAATEAAA